MATKVDDVAKLDFSAEMSEWIEAFDDVVAADWENGAELVEALRRRAREAGVPTPSDVTTPYRNTIPQHDEVPYPGDRNLERRVERQQFRPDLYYRLNVVQMHLPPLRDRRDDIPLLAQLFVVSSAQQFKKTAKRFSHAALRALEEYSWPGNVRELENAVQRAVVLSEGQTVDVCHLPAAIRNTSEEPPNNGSYEEEVRQFKRRLLIRTLRKCGWRKAESARALGVARGYLHRLINQLEINNEEELNYEVNRVEKLPAPSQIM